jgi:protein disulfide-isomerase
MAHFQKIFFTVTLLVLLSGYGLHAQETKDGLEWYTDITQSAKLSKETKKPVFGFFTGSDWCGWCHKLEADVISKPGFKAWAKKNVILMELDFPRAKQQPEELAKQNSSLQQFFHVQGYPTVWIFDIAQDSATRFNILPRGSLGYPAGNPGREEKAFLHTADSILHRKVETAKR